MLHSMLALHNFHNLQVRLSICRMQKLLKSASSWARLTSMLLSMSTQAAALAAEVC